MFSLEGKGALIAGGTRGVGKEIALTLARMGATLALTYAHDDAAASAALDEVREIAPKSVLVKADLEDEGETRAMVRTAAERLGTIDIFVMNAVSTTTKSILDVTTRSFWRTMTMNVGGFLVAAQELSELIPDNGRVILITGNTTTRYPTATTEVLGVAKAAMEAVMRLLAFHLGARGITVNAVGLGLVDTDSSRYSLEKEGPGAFELRDRMSRTRSALKRVGTVSDVAGVVAMLCTPEAGYVTGQVVLVDGAMSIASPVEV
jgi:NAD(P)-dependent dehydrogenase (short-subunit alcohol dehydrogenase family)